MSFTAVFKTVNKRVNSTAVPNMQQDSTTLSIVLLDATSVMSPSIRISYNGNPTGWNYCMISELGRYYFINDWTSDHNQWIADLTCDVLATYKSAITASTQYVLRSESSYDLRVGDSQYPTLFEHARSKYLTYSDAARSARKYIFQEPLWFIIGVSDARRVSGPPEYGATSYYLMQSTALDNFIKYLMDDISNWSDIQDLSAGTQKALINPLSYIVSCVALPQVAMFDYASNPSNLILTNAIRFGYYSYTNQDATAPIYHVKNRYIHESAYIQAPKHPQASRGLYLNTSPYSQYTLYAGPMGEIPLDGNDFIEASNIRIDFNHEISTGICEMELYRDAETVPFKKVISNVGIQISLSQSVTNGFNYLRAKNAIESASLETASAGTSGVINALTLNYKGAISDAYRTQQAAINYNNAIYSAQESKFPQVSRTGQDGTWSDYSSALFPDIFFLVADFTTIASEDIHHVGRPLCQDKVLSTLSGFCQVLNPDVSINGTMSEEDQINGYLSAGFFIE